MTKKDMRIGIAMSGGGLRAAVFHFGMLARLAEDELLEQVTFISTVSGGSMGMGLVFANSGGNYPSSGEFLIQTLPLLKQTLITINLGWRYVGRIARSLHHIVCRNANDFAKEIENHWEIGLNLQDLPVEPRWMINASCYETGKNWRFMRKRMGDTQFGYVGEPNLTVCEAIAASSAIPFLVGSFILDTRRSQWFNYDDDGKVYCTEPPFGKVHLFDGALYDNQGLEALIKRDDSDIDFLIVSNAGKKLTCAKYGLGIKRYWRIKEIVESQSSSLYTRRFFDDYLYCKKRKGRYFQFGNSAKYILTGANMLTSFDKLEQVLSPSERAMAFNVSTMSLKLSRQEFDCLFLHGYEVANCTLHAYEPERFELRANFPAI